MPRSVRVERVGRLTCTGAVLGCGGLGIAATVPLGAAAAGLVPGIAAGVITFFLLGMIGAVAVGLLGDVTSESSGLTFAGVVLGMLLGLFGAVCIGAGFKAALHLVQTILVFAVAGAGAGGVLGGAVAYKGSRGGPILGGVVIVGGLGALVGASYGAWAGFPTFELGRFSIFLMAVSGVILGMAGGAGGVAVGFLLAIPLAAAFEAWSRGEPVVLYVLLYVAVNVLLPRRCNFRFEEWRAEVGELSGWHRVGYVLGLLWAALRLALDERRPGA